MIIRFGIHSKAYNDINNVLLVALCYIICVEHCLDHSLDHCVDHSLNHSLDSKLFRPDRDRTTHV